MLYWVLSDGGQQARPGLKASRDGWAVTTSSEWMQGTPTGPGSAPHPAKAPLRIHFGEMGALIVGRRILHLSYAPAQRLRATQLC